MSDQGITLAEQLFRYVDVRERKPEERLYRAIDEMVAEFDCSVDRLTWDWYDCSVEIYLDSNEVPAALNLDPLWNFGFAVVWVHPFKCTKDGRRDHATCKCPGNRRPR